LTVIVGDDEAAKNLVIVRDMNSKEQVEFPLASAARSLLASLKPA
jgi:histidyl-tRNA synthetase